MPWQQVAPICGPGHGSQPLEVPPGAFTFTIPVNAPDPNYELFITVGAKVAGEIWNTTISVDPGQTSVFATVQFGTPAPPGGGIINWFAIGKC